MQVLYTCVLVCCHLSNSTTCVRNTMFTEWMRQKSLKRQFFEWNVTFWQKLENDKIFKWRKFGAIALNFRTIIFDSILFFKWIYTLRSISIKTILYKFLHRIFLDEIQANYGRFCKHTHVLIHGIQPFVTRATSECTRTKVTYNHNGTQYQRHLQWG